MEQAGTASATWKFPLMSSLCSSTFVAEHVGGPSEDVVESATREDRESLLCHNMCFHFKVT